MKRLKNKWVIGIFVIIIVIGCVFKTQRKTPFDIILTKNHTTVTKNDQIAYLKKHEEEMTDYVKSQNSKVTSVQWDWQSLEVREVQPDAGGIPTGDKYSEIKLEGGFNDIKTSNFQIIFGLSKTSDFPKISNLYLSQDLRIGGDLFE